MDFTIITPNLNYAHFLSECLESVASQPGVACEHLVLDGGSTDESLEVASQFPHATWISESDRGMSDAINKGFDRATGEWVMWLNADDKLKPDILASCLSILNRSNADVVYGDWEFIEENGETLRKIRSPGWSQWVHIHHQCLIGSTATFLRRRSTIEASFRLRTDFHYVMDGEFYARLAQAGRKFERMPLTISDFRLHEKNASHRHLDPGRNLDSILRAEIQHVESRAIRRAYGITLFRDPYLNGLVDGFLWIAARIWKQVLKWC
jgi:glycosyltransferase involved in cell wall biosynthesis